MTDSGGIHFKKHGIFILALLLLFIALFIFYLDWQSSHRNLTFAVLNVGQGDAIFIESPTGTQILVDGGPRGKGMSELSRVMPLFDNTIDAIIITNPDADHIAGFLDVLKNYKVGQVFEAGTFNDSKTYRNLKDQIKNKNIPNTLAKKGMRLDLGGGAVIDILFPDRDVSAWTTNDGSIVAKLTYGETSIMLTGDSTSETEDIILQSFSPSYLNSDILKVGHHGSHTSTSVEFVNAITPEYSLISLGKTNKYGHPHKETLETLENFGTEILRTDELGTIIFKCDTMGECKIN
ncbi:MAG: MBL fold metallo-hydrolase [bacterium]|nr:MBL fold metallo-hydrolase [bacterium]